MEQTHHNLLHHWFIGLAMNDAVWVPGVFTKNRERLLAHDAVIKLFNHIVETADRKGWLSGEHFSVAGTLILAWPSHRSFVRKDGSSDDDKGGAMAAPPTRGPTPASRARLVATTRKPRAPTRLRG